MKQMVKRVLGFIICANTILFLALAYLHRLPNDPKSAIFIDFWGRFTVYSLWFIGWFAFSKIPRDSRMMRGFVLLLVCGNIPLFLSLAYFDKISMNENSIVFVDFWGRLTVYSVWVLCYEVYKIYMGNSAPDSKALE